MVRYVAFGLVVVTAALLYQHLQTSAHPHTNAAGGSLPQKINASTHQPTNQESDTPDADKSQPGASNQSLVHMAADIFQGGTRVVDDVVQELAGLTPEEEQEIGDKVHRTLLTKHTVIPAESARLTRLAQPLLRNTHNRTFAYTFTVIDSSQFNAFAHIGGHIYVYKGLLDVAENDSELLFVLAHEIGHVEREHCARHAAYAKASREVAGDIGEMAAQLVYSGISRGYSEDLELEADEWSYNTLRSQGMQHDSIISFLFKMADVETKSGRSETSDDESIITVIGDHFRTHPPTSLRIRQLETYRNQ